MQLFDFCSFIINLSQWDYDFISALVIKLVSTIAQEHPTDFREIRPRVVVVIHISHYVRVRVTVAAVRDKRPTPHAGGAEYG